MARLLFGALLVSGALEGQEPPRLDTPVAPSAAGEPANPGVSRLERSEGLLAAVRSAAAERDATALASATAAYVSYLEVLRDEIGRAPRADGPALPDKLVVGRTVALQATALDSLAKAAPRRLRKDVERALAAADGLLETLAKGWSSPAVRPQPESHAGHSRSTSASSGGHH
ncbi:MAG: hypothetical protein IPF66_23020 [Holophagales bacterium]|nr:hypothetical protein [Holophagales bacterium]